MRSFRDCQRARFLRRDIRQYGIRCLRDAIAYVGQESQLFADTVENNIRFGNFNATIEEVVAAAKAAEAHDFILRLPDGTCDR